MLSAVVLAKNKNEILPATLLSLAFCDEVITLVNPKLTDFSAQRNKGLRQAKGDWVLFVDSDEVVTPKLAAEIKEKITATSAQGFYLRRLDHFFGSLLQYGETGHFCELRLGRKTAGHWERKVHEQWKISGLTGKSHHYLVHYSHPTISQFITQINFYTNIDAGELIKEGKGFSYFRTIANPIGKFFQNYLLRLGFLDGLAGFVMAYMMSLYSLIVRVKQYDLSQAS